MGADAEAVYLVSELVRGRSFAELQRANALSDADVGRIGVALADALGHAHARGVIHRDVKPQNVIVLAEPAAGAGFAKLADCGVAHLVGDDPLTRTGDVVGTLAYMAPEQAEGHPPTGACDVYALALTLYEGLAGENPMRGRSPAETARLVGRPPPFLRDYRRDLPAEMCQAIDGCLEPKADRRSELGELRASLAAAILMLGSRGGLVEPRTLARVGLRRRNELEEDRPPPAVAAALGGVEPGGADLAPAPGAGVEPSADADAPLRRPILTEVRKRAGAGVAAGALVLAALSDPAVAPPVAPVTGAAVVALATALLPRVAWLATTLALVAWLALGAGLDGAALVVMVALAPTPLLLLRAGPAWSLPALAPLLGAIALAPAFAALAGLASTVVRRAGLGAAGYLWLAAAEALAGERFLYGAPAAVPSPEGWTASLPDALTDVLLPFVSTPALAPALVWAVFAALVPLAVRGWSLGADLARGAVWAAALASALLALGDVLAAADAGSDPHGAVLGPILGIAVVLGISTLRRARFDRPGVRDEHPPVAAMGSPDVA
jgi:eukaryotic-like serine/threonine-protein kinase